MQETELSDTKIFCMKQKIKDKFPLKKLKALINYHRKQNKLFR
jgi:hypothetical protein